MPESKTDYRDQDDEDDIKTHNSNINSNSSKSSYGDAKASINAAVDENATSSTCPSSKSHHFLLAPFVRTLNAFQIETDGNRKWNWRLILPVSVFFCSFCANVGGRQVITDELEMD